jgi:hypothetical protein
MKRLENVRWLLLFLVASELAYFLLQQWAIHLRATLPTR